MSILIWSITLWVRLECPVDGCPWYTELATADGRNVALIHHLDQAHGM